MIAECKPDDTDTIATTDGQPDPMAALLPEIAGLRAVQAAMAKELAKQAAQINELLGPAQYLALLACDRGGFSAETLRKWCVAGTVEAYQDVTGHWYVNSRSLRAHLAKQGLARAIRKA